MAISLKVLRGATLANKKNVMRTLSRITFFLISHAI